MKLQVILEMVKYSISIKYIVYDIWNAYSTLTSEILDLLEKRLVSGSQNPITWEYLLPYFNDRIWR